MGRWTRQGSGRRWAADSSSLDRPYGLSLKSDPTLPATSQAIVDGRGRRVGDVRRSGDGFTASDDDYSRRFSSAQGALRTFAQTMRERDAGAENS